MKALLAAMLLSAILPSAAYADALSDALTRPGPIDMVEYYRAAARERADQSVREKWISRGDLLKAGYKIQAVSGSSIYLQRGASAYGCFAEGAPYCRPLR